MRALNIFLALTSTALAILSFSPAWAASYKCKSADGKIEYSDSPCATDKQNLNKPVEAATKAPLTAMERLTLLMKEYEEPLCEREKLALEMEKHRNITPAERATLKPKYDRLTELAETQLTFQKQASKITQSTGAHSAESTALRKFQSKIKQCPGMKAAPVTPSRPAAPIAK